MTACLACKNIFKPGVRVVLSQVVAIAAVNIFLVVNGIALGFPIILVFALAENNSEEILTLNENQLSWIGSINLLFFALGNLLSGVPVHLIGCKKTMLVMDTLFLGYCLILKFSNAFWQILLALSLNGLAGSINLLFFALGNLLSGVPVHLIGCKKTMLVMDTLFLGYCLILKFSNAFWQILLALSLNGLAGGLIEAAIPSYVSEISQPNLRGMFLASISFARVVGTLIIILLGSALQWRNAALLSSIFPLISISVLLLIPESPIWLLNKNKLSTAHQNLSWLRGWASLEETVPEFQEMCGYVEQVGNPSKRKDTEVDKLLIEGATINLEKQTDVSWTQRFRRKNFIWPLSIVIFVIFIEHCTGVLTLHYYSLEMFTAFQVPVNKYYAAVCVYLSELSGCFLASFLVHYMGKRLLNFISITLTAVCFTIVGIYSYLAEIKYLMINDVKENALQPNEDLYGYTWIPLFFLLLATFLNCCGIQPLVWVLIGEVYSENTKAIGSSVSIFAYNLIAFFVIKISLQTISALTLSGTFWLFACVGCIAVAVLYVILPETEGKSLQEISNHFQGISKLDNTVRKPKSTLINEQI